MPETASPTPSPETTAPSERIETEATPPISIDTPPKPDANITHWIITYVVTLSAASVGAFGVSVVWPERQSGEFVTVVATILCGIGGWLDLATRRIPNMLTYPAILFGLVASCVLQPIASGTAVEAWLAAPGPRSCLLGLGLAAAVGIPSFMLRGLGGGDVKLIGALGTLLGVTGLARVGLNAIAIAGLIGITNWIVNGTLVARAQVVMQNISATLFGRIDPGPIYPFRPTEAPFGLALFVGLVIHLLGFSFLPNL